MVIEAVQRNMRRAAKAVHEEMERGLSSLASISSTAPLLGMLGTISVIPGFCQNWGSEGDVASEVPEGFIYTALGLAVAILAEWFRKYLKNKVVQFDLEMESVTLELANLLRP